MKNIYKALAAFQQECPIIHKAASGYNYTYADLKAIFKVIMPLLKVHKLGFTQLLQGDAMETIIFHIESGEELKSSVNIPQGVKLNKMNEFQVLGSSITYLRRYALSSALGLVTDKDLDSCIAPESPSKSKIDKAKSIMSAPVKKDEKKVLTNIEFNNALDRYFSVDKNIFKKAIEKGFKLTESQKLDIKALESGKRKRNVTDSVFVGWCTEYREGYHTIFDDKEQMKYGFNEKQTEKIEKIVKDLAA